jgi:hypothetical protein
MAAAAWPLAASAWPGSNLTLKPAIFYDIGS